MSDPLDDLPDGEATLRKRVSALVGVAVDGPREDRLSAVYDLVSIAEAHPEIVSSAASALRPVLTEADDPVREATALVFATIGGSAPETVLPVAEDLATLLAGTSTSANNALLALMPVLESSPEQTLDALEDHWEAIRTLATSDVATIRQRATRLLLAFAGFRPASIAEPETVSALLDVLERTTPDHSAEIPEGSDGVTRQFDEFVTFQERREQQREATAREMAALALAELAAERPSAFEGEVDRLVTFVDDRDPTVRAGTIDAVGRVAPVDRVASETALPPLVTLLVEDGRWPEIRSKAATALGLLAEVHPQSLVDAVQPHAEDFRELLWADDEGVRGGGVGVLAYLAEVDPSLARPARDRLLELLDDDAPFVRGNAALTLGFLDEPELEEQLRTLSRTDPDETVRRTAAQAVDEPARSL
jgi:HEAT repeat protein